MTAEELFLKKYGNEITAKDSWVIRFANEYAESLARERAVEFVLSEKKTAEEICKCGHHKTYHDNGECIKLSCYCKEFVDDTPLNLIERIDDLLTLMEDDLHGVNGDRVSTCRGLLIELRKYKEEYASQSHTLTPEEEQAISRWVSFDFDKIETRPTKYGKYLICRKDGKIHWETWNGSGWAYNHNEIRYWAVIVTPINKANERRGK